jgi:hypothetical protein
VAGDQRPAGREHAQARTGAPIDGRLRPGVTIEEAADVQWATNSSELFVLLTIERRWSLDRYERWLAESWTRLLLDATD